jgi:hypothetical protein
VGTATLKEKVTKSPGFIKLVRLVVFPFIAYNFFSIVGATIVIEVPLLSVTLLGELVNPAAIFTAFVVSSLDVKKGLPP